MTYNNIQKHTMTYNNIQQHTMTYNNIQEHVSYYIYIYIYHYRPYENTMTSSIPSTKNGDTRSGSPFPMGWPYHGFIGYHMLSLYYYCCFISLQICIYIYISYMIQCVYMYIYIHYIYIIYIYIYTLYIYIYNIYNLYVCVHTLLHITPVLIKPCTQASGEGSHNNLSPPYIGVPF